jgi:hypothetical protein
MSKDYALFVLKRLVTYEAAILAGIAVLCVVFGWHSVNEISLALLGFGALIFAIGPFSMMGGWGTTRSFQYMYTRTMETTSSQNRMAQDRAEINRSIGLIVPSVLLGTLTMIVGIAVQTLLS